MIVVLLLLIMIPLGFNIFLLMSPKLTPYHPKETIIYDASKKTSYVLNNSHESRYIEINEIDDKIKRAIVLLEDKNFYSHHGIDILRTIKSGFTNIKENEIVSGASTITQQVARLIYLNNDKTFSRKINELSLSFRLEKSLSKDKILELYLNLTYFGKNIYGLENAAQYYFNKSATSLKLNEAIALFTLLPSPNNYSPEVNIALFKKAYKNNLDKLLDLNLFDIVTYRLFINEVLDFKFTYLDTFDRNYNFIFDEINQEKKKINGAEDKSLKINSTFDFEIQNIIIESIDELKDKLSPEEVSIIVMKPNSSDVLALVSGHDYYQNSFDRARLASKQIGSTIKPLLYELALENGLNPLSKFDSSPTSFFIDNIGEYTPANNNNTYANKPITMVEAIATSDNIYAVKTGLLIGSASISNKLKEIGIKLDKVDPTIALGSISMSPLQLTSIYNCFASLGDYYYPRFIKSYQVNGSDKINYYEEKKINNYLSNKQCQKIAYLLRSPFDKVAGSYTSSTMLQYLPKNRWAAKTGTVPSANYVMAYNPYYTLGIYVGNDETSNVYDKSLSKKLFKSIADKLMDKKKDIFFTVSEQLTPFQLTNVNNEHSFIYYR